VLTLTDAESRPHLGFQAYDGHMNLILSDVEETTMLVDGAEGAASEHGVVNVSPSVSSQYTHSCPHITAQVAKRKMEMLFVRGDGVILVRTSFSSALSISALLVISGIASFTDVTSVLRAMAFDVVQFCALLGSIGSEM